MKSVWYLFALPGLLNALPQSLKIHAGSAKASCGESRMEIEAADRSILYWDDFSIGELETVEFFLPTSDSAVLNRVLGNLPSQILGKLSSNGKVLLLNPNGVLFGSNAQLDAGSFVASALDVNDRLFIEGKELVYTGTSQEAVLNKGNLFASSGDLSLYAAKIENHGLICAPNGAILLADAASLGISNFGTIEAKRFEVSSSGAAGTLIFLNQGCICAGEVSVLIESGMCAISGSIHSPSITLLSEEIALLNGSLLHGTENPKAFQIGNGPRLAKAVLMEPEAQICIDGVLKAGSLFMNAETLNAVYGKISGRGEYGAEVDISCNGRLIYEGLADLSSPSGNMGTLRFDPVDITVTTAGTTIGFTNTCMGTLCTGSPCSLLLPGGNCIYYPSGGAGFNINNAALSGQLAVSNVILDASAAGPGTGTISFTSGTVSWAAATTLFLIAPAGGSILVNTIVQNTGVGAAAGNVSINMLGAGTITVTPTVASTTAAIGSRNGSTLICAPLADVNILGIDVSSTLAQVGGLLTLAPVGTATGPICVDCANLTIDTVAFPASGTSNRVTRLGHGYLMSPTLAAALNLAGNITVNCDTLTIFGGGGMAGHAVLFFGAQLGHLYPVFPGGTTSVNGNISVDCAGFLSLTGGVDENTPAVIGHAYGNSNTAGAAGIGTSQGDILVNAGDVVLEGGTFNPLIPGVTWVAQAQIGHNNMGNTINTVANVTNIGSITVNSANGVILTGGSDPGGGGASHVAPAQIGHGAIGIEIDSTQLSESIGDILVSAQGNITLTGGPTNGAYAKIGHGDNLLDGPGVGFLPNGDCTGNITVLALGSLTLTPSASANSNAHIGHGIEQFIHAIFVPPNFPVVDSGNISVSASGPITLDSTPGQSFSGAWIGHGANSSNGFSVISLTATGNIDVFTPSTLNLIGGVNGSFAYIGHLGSNLTRMGGGIAPFIVQGHTHAEANLISMRTRGDDVMIGTQKLLTTDVINFISGSVEVISATDITIATFLPAGAPSRLASIGVDYDTTISPINVFAAVCNDILLTNVLGGPSVQVAIQGRDSVYAAAGNNIVLANNNASARTFLGSYGSPGTLTQIFAGNDVLSSQTTGGVFLSYFGSGWNIANMLASGSNLTIRAAGDVVLSSSFPITPTPAAGNIFIEADTGFSPGGAGSLPGNLWNFSGGTLNAIANTALPAPLPAAELFACFMTNPTILSDTVGGVYFNTAPLAAGPSFAAAGSVTVNSASNGDLGIADLILTSAPAASPNQLNIATAGSICISGFNSGCGPRVADFCLGDNIYGIDSFNNITINQALAPTLPTGGIYISANNTLTDNSPVTTTAGSIVLISDNDRTGAGDLLVNSVVASDSGLIFLQAGVYGTGLSSIFENTPAQIVSMTGNVVLSAASTINLLSTAAPAITTGGFIHMIADDAINFGSAPISTSIAGDSVFVISGSDININSASTITAARTVRLVVDNNNCCPNTLPTCRISNTPGIVNMAATASIIGGAIQIYTAYQGTSLLNGTLNGVVYGFGAFTPGTPFVDTSYEQWCSCCGCFSCTPVGIGNSNPFTVFYKPCLPLIVQQATVIVDELLIDLHPYNEFPGWLMRFLVQYSAISNRPTEPYYFRRRHLNIINHPKSWTVPLY